MIGTLVNVELANIFPNFARETCTWDKSHENDPWRQSLKFASFPIPIESFIGYPRENKYDAMSCSNHSNLYE